MSPKSKKGTKLTVCLVLAFLILAVAVVCFGTGYIRRNSDGAGTTRVITADSSAEIADRIVSETGLTNVAKLENYQVGNYYGIPMDIISNSVVYKSTSALSADEVAVFRASDKQSISTIASAVDNRVAECRSSYSSLNSEESQKIDNCLIESSGEYIVLVICSDTADAEKAISEFYK